MSSATLLPPIQDMPTKPKPLTTPTLAGRGVPAGREVPAGRAVLAGREVPAGRAVHRIVLTGFMGSGKTTVGSLLADRLGWGFLDLDHEIERRHNRTVPQIFSESGEAHFRHLESATLASLLGQRNIVLALGGGAPEQLGNRLLLEQTPHTAIVYLAAPFETLAARCARQAEDPTATARPNLADLSAAERRFHLRRTHYERIAAHTINTSTLTLDQTTDAILTLLRIKAS